MAVTSAPQRSSAPAARAAASSSAVTAPMPPMGTSQWPLPLPITWYRKQRFWRRSASCAPAKVPMSASVSAIPRSVSSPRQSSMSSPMGRSTSAAHAASSPTSARRSAAERSGSVIVGHSARAARAHVAYRRSQPSIAAGVAGGGPERGRGALAVLGVDQHPARRVGGQRCVGRDPPPAEPDLEAQLVDDPLRQQAHEVGVARQARVDAGPRALGHGRPADVVAALEDQHRAPGARQVGGGDQAVVPAADDHGVVSRVGCHQSANRWPWIATRPSTSWTSPSSWGMTIGSCSPVSTRRCSIAASSRSASARSSA